MQQFRISGSDVDPIRSRHNVKQTRETIRQLLAGGTPAWVRWPNEYRNFVKESFQAEKELSDQQVSDYKMDDQELLVNEKARKVNIIPTREFIRKLRANGVRCFTIYNGMPQTVGLWAVPEGKKDPIYVCYLQIPFCCEWSVLRVDRHGLPNGESYRGWRTVIAQLIVKKIISEKKVHEIFGYPTESLVSRRYRHTLFNFRNGIGIAESTL